MSNTFKLFQYCFIMNSNIRKDSIKFIFNTKCIEIKQSIQQKWNMLISLNNYEFDHVCTHLAYKAKMSRQISITYINGQ